MPAPTAYGFEPMNSRIGKRAATSRRIRTTRTLVLDPQAEPESVVIPIVLWDARVPRVGNELYEASVSVFPSRLAGVRDPAGKTL